jgi:hypothetical protein
MSSVSQQWPIGLVVAGWLKQACAHCRREFVRRRCTKGGDSLPLCASCIRTDDDTVLDIKILPDPPERAWFGVEVVHRDIEETLDLTGVKIHGDHMITPGGLKHVGHELRCDWRSRLVLLVLAGIGKVRNHSSDAACGGCFARVDHDQKFHQSIVDLARRRRLQDEDCTRDELQSICVACKMAHTIFISDRLANGNGGLLVRVLKNQDLGQFYSQPADIVSRDFR